MTSQSVVSSVPASSTSGTGTNCRSHRNRAVSAATLGWLVLTDALTKHASPLRVTPRHVATSSRHSWMSVQVLSGNRAWTASGSRIATRRLAAVAGAVAPRSSPSRRSPAISVISGAPRPSRSSAWLSAPGLLDVPALGRNRAASPQPLGQLREAVPPRRVDGRQAVIADPARVSTSFEEVLRDGPLPTVTRGPERLGDDLRRWFGAGREVRIDVIHEPERCCVPQ